MNKINKYTWFPTEPVVETPPKPSEILYSFPKIFIFGFNRDSTNFANFYEGNLKSYDPIFLSIGLN